MNSLEVIEWNMDKNYLNYFQSKGVPIAPSIFLKKGDKINIKTMMKEKEWNKGFIKPIFGQGARETMRFDSSPEEIKKA